MIGRNNDLPWHLPADLQHFQRLTTAHTVVMGRKTFDSIGRRPLAHRRNIVLTRDPSYQPPGVEIARSLEEALALSKGDGEVFIAGGEEVYRRALHLADRLYLTVVHAVVEGDARFPEFDREEWTLSSEEYRPPDERHRFGLSFRRYDRRRSR